MPNSVQTSIEAATVPIPAGMEAHPVRFFIPVPETRDPMTVAAQVTVLVTPMAHSVDPLSASAPRDLVLVLPGRTFMGPPENAFAAGHAIEDALSLSPIEPEIFHQVMPINQPADEPGLESVDNFPGCWAPAEPRIEADKSWVLTRMRVREAWALSEAKRRPSRGEGVIIAQIDTGVTRHPELADVVRAGSYNILGDGKTRDDVTDPMKEGNTGHGTGTGSVVVSPENLDVVGTAPNARHLPIRAIESVVRLSQTNVAAAIDRAVEMGAHVISMSLGGIWSYALQRALARAVAADVIVLAAAGNCVGLVVWPARFDDCIAVAGTNFDDGIWKGTCSGASVTISAPAQNVYRASAVTGKSGQGQGTSFAVALAAGVAACWLAHHGRSTLAAEARERGETLQAMFRRLLKATARKPNSDWDSFNMGAGIVDARALFETDLDAGRETETPQAAYRSRTEDASLREFALEAFGELAAAAQVDWMKYGAQTSLAVFAERRAERAAGAGLEGAAGSAPQLPAAVTAALAAAGQPASEPQEFPTPGLKRARSAATATNGGKSERIARLRKQIVARQMAEKPKGGKKKKASPVATDRALELEATVPPDAPMPHPDDVLDRIWKIADAMPDREVGDPVAFSLALRQLYEHGNKALGKLGDLDLGPDHNVTADEESSLEALIIADGTRPSFLLADGLPPEDHPFLGIWRGQMSAHRETIQTLAKAVGRVQPTGGHASNFIGTATIVDAGKGFAMTNYHVVDDARNRWSVPMIQSGNSLKIPSGLEIDFAGEASRLDQNRFRVVEAILPRGFGRGFGNLDAALLRIEPLPGAANAIPAPAVTLDSQPAFVTGGASSLIVIGFPGPAPRQFGREGEVDWAFVTNTLFGGLFGFKRVAPGKISRQLGFDEKDQDHTAFGHDCTTFGGTSGATLAAWDNPGAPVFGLHFAGKTLDVNAAIAITQAADALREIGVPIT
jgi:subtilisin family serine protease